MPSHAQIFTWKNHHVRPTTSATKPTNPHWHQQETDNNNMATMATAFFVTKQQPTFNIIISITQIVLTIVDDAVSLS
jgi:hypothetical protein